MLRAADRYAYTGCGSTAYCYLFYLGDEQILIHIRKPCRTSACLVRIAGPCPAVPFQLVPVQLCLSSWFLSSWVSLQLAHASCGVRTCESPPKRGLHATGRTRVIIESMEETAAYIRGGQGGQLYA